MYLKENEKINILKEFDKGKIKIYQEFILIDSFSDFRKKILLKLFSKIQRYFIKNQISKNLYNDFNNILWNKNIILFNKRWISNKLELFNTWEITDILLPLLLTENDKKNLEKILLKYNKNKLSLNFNEIEFIKNINLLVNNILLKDYWEIAIILYKELLKEYELLKEIITNNKKKIKEENSLLFIDNNSHKFFAYIYNKKIYPFNIYIHNMNIIIKKDNIYNNIYNKKDFFWKDNIYKIKKINKNLIEKIIIKKYSLSPNILVNINIKSIFKKEIKDFIKLYF